MNRFRKILSKMGPIAGVLVAAAVMLLLTRQQPKLNEQKALPQPVVSTSADKQLELVEMRAEPFVRLLQKAVQQNPAAFSFNAGDTSGRRLMIRYSDEAAVKAVLLNEVSLTPQQLSLFKNNGVAMANGEIDLPVSRNKGVLLVRVPSVMALGLAKLQQ